MDGVDATEAAFRGQAPQHAWVHLITHGFFAPPEWSSRLSEAAAPDSSAKPHEAIPAALSRNSARQAKLIAGPVSQLPAVQVDLPGRRVRQRAFNSSSVSSHDHYVAR
jgi:hypothetical protein